MIKKLTSGSPLKNIILFSIPLLIGNLFQQVYALSDSIIVGKTIGVSALGAIGSTDALQFAVFFFFFGLTNGITVLTGQCFGANDLKEMRRSVTTGTLITAAGTIAASALMYFFMPVLLRLVNVPDDIFDQALVYSNITFGLMACMIFYNLVTGIFRALGDSLTPLIFLIVSCAVNVVLDLVFIMVFHLGIAGAAWATVLSQFLSCLGCIIYLKIKFPIMRFQPGEWKFSKRIARTELRIAMPIALQFLITACGSVILSSVLNSLGTTFLVASSIATKIDGFSFMPMMALSTALTNFTAQNYGAKLYYRIYLGFRDTLYLSIAFCALFAVVLPFTARQFSMFFISEGTENLEEIIHIVKIYVTWFAAFSWSLGLLHAFRHVQQGMGHSFIPMLAGVGELFARIFGAFFLVRQYGYHGASFANPFAWIVATIILYFGYREARQVWANAPRSDVSVEQ